ITLLTDFGTEDGYVGAIKGRILSKDPDIKIVDISHTIPKYDVRSASFNISNFVDYFPKGTIHLSIIDPGVGGKRKPLIIKTDNFVLITPDNGTASFIFESYRCEIFKIKTDWLKWVISDTFHGRDIFAPAAAELAIGKSIEEIAVPFEGEALTFVAKAKMIQNNKWELNVLHVDHFGNIITNLKKNQLEKNSDLKNCRIQIGKIFLHGIKKSYSDVNKGECLLLWGSSDYLEIAQNKGNANAFFNLTDKKKLFFEF
ncbi:MAG: SAM-dependent chlorinase/fluorinase, partial [Calditrichia bacterium]|nr:SAM-dependent chlorinase/fluorinase [Calditrichia bacterium]